MNGWGPTWSNCGPYTYPGCGYGYGYGYGFGYGGYCPWNFPTSTFVNNRVDTVCNTSGCYSLTQPTITTCNPIGCVTQALPINVASMNAAVYA